MNKIKAFFMGLILLIITFVVVFFAVLMYSANDNMSIKSYIFQTNNSASQRVGRIQDIKDIPPEELRNNLIRKYISEYFKVIPGETDVENRPVLRSMSSAEAYKQWQEGEAKNIAQMSAKNMFRIVYVLDTDISVLNKPAGFVYNDDAVFTPIYYTVRYYTQTWDTPNSMGTEPFVEQGIINIEVSFAPGIRRSINVRDHLENGESPLGLFKFIVNRIGDKGIE